MQPYAAFDERGPLYLARSAREFDHGTITVPRALRARVRPRHDHSTSRAPRACSTTARSQYLAHSAREFDHGTITVPRALRA
ncbi:MAG TPA: hypothetical protein PKN61_05665, partial [Acidobacteriota bacterium]|nr:hypothetical protein [Acidobacteriota bacterium]